jgi:phage host-nuclease inhibitor protein Gam
LIIPLSNESIEEFVARVEQIGVKQREAEKLQIKMQREKQFNRKVEVNAQLRDIRKEIEVLEYGKNKCFE